MIKNNKGFSLLELLVAITILTVVTIVAYSSFASQNRSYLIQEEVAEMQQNLRAAMGYMTREIRMATANPKSILGLTGFCGRCKHTPLYANMGVENTMGRQR